MQGLLGSMTAPAAAPAPPASTGFFADLKQKFREGKFKTYARWLGVLNVFITVGFTLMMFSLMIPSGIFCIIIGVLVGIIELPFCCTVLPLCQKISSYMTFFEVYMIRGVLYIALGVIFILLFISMGGILNLIYGPLFIINGLMYMLAHCRGEAHTKEDNSVSSLGVNTTQLKAKAAAAAMGVV
mmetsp:Transcript_21390/g.44934  ORF Transcript_21390/g.44934 Transcript_21390/m.44934 type:complete len:184 (-) Transcript_21390:348-899(-)